MTILLECSNCHSMFAPPPPGSARNVIRGYLKDTGPGYNPGETLYLGDVSIVCYNCADKLDEIAPEILTESSIPRRVKHFLESFGKARAFQIHFIEVEEEED